MRKKERKKIEKRKQVEAEIQSIKESNLVKNFSEEVVPDEAYLYLALGSTFCPVADKNLHDYVFDAKDFCRKLAWSVYHKQRKVENEIEGRGAADPANTDPIDTETRQRQIPAKLRIKSRKNPEINDNLLTHVTEKIMDGVKKIEMPKKKLKNLTLLEAKGMRWCRKAVRERRIYITKVDKGGCILILQADTVDQIMQETLNDTSQFEELEKDPREDIKKIIKNSVTHYLQSDLLTQAEAFAICGITSKGGMSHGHEFVVKKTHMYPLFKYHKLSLDDINKKVIPPTRMVTSGVGGPTFRLGTFLDNLLKPVVMEYCKNEVVKDSTEFITELRKIENDGTATTTNLIGTLDVDALYPSIQLNLAIEALRDALETASNFSSEEIAMIIELAELCINNSVVHYRGSWYRIILGLPTGGPESGSIANIVVFYVLEKILFVDSTVAPLNKIAARKRFLDDIWFMWMGTARQFSKFKAALNRTGKTVGITFKGDVAPSVDFLDVTTSLMDGQFTTKLYVKPTDATRYLHRRSDHGKHTFRSIPYSQFRRAVVLCSKEEDRIKSIQYMSDKFIKSGYSQEEVDAAKRRSSLINREDILAIDNDTNALELLFQDSNNEEDFPGFDVSVDETKQMTFIVNRDAFMSGQIKHILKENQDDINTLLGAPTRLIVAERRNQNTASLLFAKSGFSSETLERNPNQKCGGRGCLTCKTMNLNGTVTLWQNDASRKIDVKLDFRCICTTDNVIYLFICKLCPHNNSFYVGQTINPCRARANGHRAKFNVDDYQKSALSYHIHKDHPEHVQYKLKNFSSGVIKSTSPMNLDRLEDFYVDLTKAELSLNRYKVTVR